MFLVLIDIKYSMHYYIIYSNIMNLSILINLILIVKYRLL